VNVRTTVAILGAGTMGRRIAIDCAVHGFETRLHDAVPGVIPAALRWLDEHLAAWCASGRLSDAERQAASARVTTHDGLESCVRGAGVVVECVPERVAVKREVFAAAAPFLSSSVLLVSNTSSIPGSLLADASGIPHRFVNANFGHLGHQKVEVMPHPGTDRAAVDELLAFLRAMHFIPIEVRRESVGYATNRVWRAVKKEVLKLLDRGASTPADIDRGWMLDWHVSIGPCGLMDRIGLDVVRDIEMIYFELSGDPDDRPPPLLDRMVAEGKLGEKSGEGFYRWPDPEFEREDFLDG
jgi:3-hydroxybutyryl-CoA dehydrogenase